MPVLHLGKLACFRRLDFFNSSLETRQAKSVKGDDVSDLVPNVSDQLLSFSELFL